MILYKHIFGGLNMKIDWHGEFRIESKIEGDGAIVISANKDGLISLAK